LLVAHYDSVPTGSGASDDGAGVAAMLETARALKAGPLPKNDVILLFTDGEERGLLGAQAFADGHSWASDVAVVLNLETRGNTGAARLFEVGDQNGWIIGEFAKAVPYPVANSGSTAGYQLSGSDTDLTVFLDTGLPGLNVAYLEGLAHYHTRLDTVEALDAQSLQHLGSYALALTRQFADADLSRPKEPDAVFFTVLGFMVHYPAAWSVPFAALAVLLFAAVVTLG
jgi:Zn-dependent M28 family amino/carboxypeptidase